MALGFLLQRIGPNHNLLHLYLFSAYLGCSKQKRFSKEQNTRALTIRIVELNQVVIDIIIIIVFLISIEIAAVSVKYEMVKMGLIFLGKRPWAELESNYQV